MISCIPQVIELEPGLCKVIPADSFNLEKTMLSGQVFNYVRLAPSFYILQYCDKYVMVAQDEQDSLLFSCNIHDVVEVWASYLDLLTNYDESALTIELDAFAQRCWTAGKGIHILRQDPWEMCISYIISQRNKIEHIAVIINTISQQGGRHLGSVEGVELFQFPRPSDLKDWSLEDLRGCSVGFRDRYLLNFIKFLNLHPQALEQWGALPTPQLLESLQGFEGIGPKVSNCIALFGYHRTEVFPIDLWIQRIISGAYKNNLNPTEKFGDMAGIIQQYMFHYVRNCGGDYSVGG